MLSPTNYHIPTHIAEGLAMYDKGKSRLEAVIPPSELSVVIDVLSDITDPSKRIVTGIGNIAGQQLLLIDDHSRPPRNFGIQR